MWNTENSANERFVEVLKMASVTGVEINSPALFDVSGIVSFKRQLAFHAFLFISSWRVMLFIILLGTWLYLVSHLALFIFLMIIYPAEEVISAAAEVRMYRDSPDRYVFYPDRIENIGRKGRTVFYNSRIKEICETGKKFYINVGQGVYCVIDKDCFTVGNAENMRKYLSGIPNVEYRKFCK